MQSKTDGGRKKMMMLKKEEEEEEEEEERRRRKKKEEERRRKKSPIMGHLTRSKPHHSARRASPWRTQAHAAMTARRTPPSAPAAPP